MKEKKTVHWRRGPYLEVVDDASDDLGGADAVGDLDGGVDELAVVAPVERHAVVPETFEKVR